MNLFSFLVASISEPCFASQSKPIFSPIPKCWSHSGEEKGYVFVLKVVVGTVAGAGVKRVRVNNQLREELAPRP